MPKDIEVIEEYIVASCIRELLAGGYVLSVDNGGDDYEIHRSDDFDAVMAEMMNTCEDFLVVYERDGRLPIGRILFVYGNDGYDVISDLNVSIEPLIANTLKSIAYE